MRAVAAGEMVVIIFTTFNDYSSLYVFHLIKKKLKIISSWSFILSSSTPSSNKWNAICICYVPVTSVVSTL